MINVSVMTCHFLGMQERVKLWEEISLEATGEDGQ